MEGEKDRLLRKNRENLARIRERCEELFRWCEGEMGKLVRMYKRLEGER